MPDRRLPPITYPFAGRGTPAAGQTREVAPGVHWVRMPLPFGLDHINLWLLEDGDGWVIVDSGLNQTVTRDCWNEIFQGKNIGPLSGQTVHKLIVTHFHPDHVGLAAWLVTELDTELWMTRTEWLMGRMLSLDRNADNHRGTADFYRAHGLAADVADMMLQGGNMYRDGVLEVPAHHRRLQDGQVLDIHGRDWRVIVGTGHAPEQACLYCEALNVLIAGDQILPGISPNISVWASEPDADPLKDYLESFAQFSMLPADTLVLPSHNVPFQGLQTRIQQLISHHEDRLAALGTAMAAAPLSAAEAMPILFHRELRGLDAVFAIGEAIAHLVYLEYRGDAARVRDADNIWRFTAPPSAKAKQSANH